MYLYNIQELYFHLKFYFLVHLNIFIYKLLFLLCNPGVSNSRIPWKRNEFHLKMIYFVWKESMKCSLVVGPGFCSDCFLVWKWLVSCLPFWPVIWISCNKKLRCTYLYGTVRFNIYLDDRNIFSRNVRFRWIFSQQVSYYYYILVALQNIVPGWYSSKHCCIKSYLQFKCRSAAITSISHRRFSAASKWHGSLPKATWN